tara:strand:- start:5591 stop:7654 length:2064 start_codon:yes stop_codon:yes gene_type:complete
MRWQIANYQFCEQQQTLSSSSETLQLEPMMVELLAYFCRHPNEIISVDQLIDQVWQGRVVTDNAVSRLITKLRRAFADDARQPKFIATFPKKGYKFVARVTTVNEHDKQALVPDGEQAQRAETDEKPAETGWSVLKLPIVAVIFALVVVLVFWQAWQTPRPSATFARALTSMDGNEVFPSFSADGRRMAFMSVKAQRLRLVIKDLYNGKTVEINHPDGLNTGPGDWSKQGDELVYLAASAQRCEYYIVEIKDLTPGEPRLIHRCPAGSYGKILFTHNDQRVVFSENAGAGTPYSIYELDLSTQTKRRLHQPDLYLSGNSQFDLHPHENKLLISSPDKQQWEGFYALELTTNKLELLFKQDAYICCGIWDHAGENVILMGEHPAYQLLSYDLSGKNKQVIFSGSRRISLPRRFNNQTDYVFLSGDKHTDIHILDLDSGETGSIANDTVDELLATFSTNHQSIGYISMASGKEQVWEYDRLSGERRKITSFTDNRHYLDLHWSPDDRYIAGLTFNELHLINATTGEVTVVDFPQTEIRGVSFKSASELSFSAKEGERWRVYTYHLITQSVTAESPEWTFIQFTPDRNNTLWLSADHTLYYSAQQVKADIPGSPATMLLNGRQWNLRKRESLWYWYDREGGGHIKRFHPQNGKIESLAESGVGHFDIQGRSLLFIYSSESQSNLFRTISQ